MGVWISGGLNGWLGGWVTGWLGGWVAGWLGDWVAESYPSSALQHALSHGFPMRPQVQQRAQAQAQPVPEQYATVPVGAHRQLQLELGQLMQRNALLQQQQAASLELVHQRQARHPSLRPLPTPFLSPFPTSLPPFLPLSLPPSPTPLLTP